MAFLNTSDILIIEKNTGMVKRILNGKMIGNPLLDVNVASQSESGLLGIAVSDVLNGPKRYVFLYCTEAQGKDKGQY